MSGWIDIPGGRFLVGVTGDEALALAKVSTAAVREREDRDPDLLHGLDSLGKDSGEDIQQVVKLLMGVLQAHPVELAPYQIARRPVTNAEYERFLASGAKAGQPAGWKFPKGKEPDRPVVGTSWQDAAAYAAWAGARLPTEAEWERAARGSSRRLFPWGDTYLPPGRALEPLSLHVRPVPGSIAGLGTSPEGVVDMVTRHWEWCADELVPYPGTDMDMWKKVYAMARPGFRVYRGGAMDDLVACAVGRDGSSPDFAHPETSFRLAR